MKRSSFLFACLGLGMVSCTSGDGELAVSMTSQASMTSGSSMTGAHLWVTVTELSLREGRRHHHHDDADHDHRADGAGMNDGGGDGQHHDRHHGWVKVFEGHDRLDLFDDMATSHLLGSARVPSGRVRALRLELADDAVLVQNGVSTPISCPSCATRGVKVEVPNLCVPEHGALDVTLDFDLENSVTFDGTTYQLDPVIRLRPDEVQGDTCRDHHRKHDRDHDSP